MSSATEQIKLVSQGTSVIPNDAVTNCTKLLVNKVGSKVYLYWCPNILLLLCCCCFSEMCVEK